METKDLAALDLAALDTLAGALPAARVERMRDGFRIFEGLDLPLPTDESWRYVDLDLDLSSLSPALTPGDPIAPGAFLSALPDRSGSATVVDGQTVSLESAPGVELFPVRSLEADHDLFDLVPADTDVFAAARAAFGTDGVLIRVASGRVVDAPIVVDVQATADTASFPYLCVDVGDDSEASVVFVYRSPDSVAALVSPLVGMRTGEGSRLRFLAVQDLGFRTTAVIHQRAVVGRDATLRIGEVGLGGKVARLDLGVTLEGAGGSAEVVGLSFGERDQTLDYRMVMNHRGRNTSSDVFLKGAVEDEARSVFTGLLKIEKDAIRSSAFETNRNLVLSEGAKAHSVPNLEILCDDVVCGHGSSVGPLEQDHLYYLQSRGLSRERAERLLIRGFFQEVIDRLPVGGLEKPIEDVVFRRFLEAQRGGRVA